ncbi:MAG TPA: hypothetical protein VF101_16040 [Gaiellaceae bacterium]
MEPSRESRASARCCVFVVALALAGFAPSPARAADDLAAQIQNEVWAEVADATAAAGTRSRGPDLADSIEAQTWAAIGQIAGRRTAEIAEPKRPARARPKRPPPASPARQPLPAASTWHAAPAVAPPAEAPSEKRVPKRVDARKDSTRPSGANPPPRLPPLPSPPGTLSPSIGGFGAGQLFPPLLLALAAALGFFVLEGMAYDVSVRRLPRRRQVSLVPWRPG